MESYYGEALCVPLDEVVEFRQTSGTTGQPVYQLDTWQDWEWWSESWAYILYAQGFRKTDRVFLPFGYNVFVAFWAAHYGAEKLGCEVGAWGYECQEQSLKVEALPGQEGNREEMIAHLKNQLRLQTNLNYHIEIHPFQTLPRPEGKVRRFKDLRK